MQLVHPAETSGKHELYLMCEDVDKLVNAAKARGVSCNGVTTIDRDCSESN